MDKNFMNKLDDMEMDKVSGGVDVPPVYVTRTPPTSPSQSENKRVAG